VYRRISIRCSTFSQFRILVAAVKLSRSFHPLSGTRYDGTLSST